MYSREVRHQAGEYLNSWIRYMREGGGIDRLKDELDSLGLDPHGPSDVLDYMSHDLVGTAKYYVDQQLPQDCSPALVDAFVATTSVVAKEIAGTDGRDLRKLVDHLRDASEVSLSQVDDPVSGYFALHALLAPTDDGGLWDDRRRFSIGYDMMVDGRSAKERPR